MATGIRTSPDEGVKINWQNLKMWGHQVEEFILAFVTRPRDMVGYIATILIILLFIISYKITMMLEVEEPKGNCNEEELKELKRDPKQKRIEKGSTKKSPNKGSFHKVTVKAAQAPNHSATSPKEACKRTTEIPKPAEARSTEKKAEVEVKKERSTKKAEVTAKKERSPEDNGTGDIWEEVCRKRKKRKSESNLEENKVEATLNAGKSLEIKDNTDNVVLKSDTKAKIEEKPKERSTRVKIQKPIVGLNFINEPKGSKKQNSSCPWSQTPKENESQEQRKTLEKIMDLQIESSKDTTTDLLIIETRLKKQLEELAILKKQSKTQTISKEFQNRLEKLNQEIDTIEKQEKSEEKSARVNQNPESLDEKAVGGIVHEIEEILEEMKETSKMIESKELCHSHSEEQEDEEGTDADDNFVFVDECAQEIQEENVSGQIEERLKHEVEEALNASKESDDAASVEQEDMLAVDTTDLDDDEDSAGEKFADRDTTCESDVDFRQLMKCIQREIKGEDSDSEWPCCQSLISTFEAYKNPVPPSPMAKAKNTASSGTLDTLESHDLTEIEQVEIKGNASKQNATEVELPERSRSLSGAKSDPSGSSSGCAGDSGNESSPPRDGWPSKVTKARSSPKVERSITEQPSSPQQRRRRRSERDAVAKIRERPKDSDSDCECIKEEDAPSLQYNSEF